MNDFGFKKIDLNRDQKENTPFSNKGFDSKDGFLIKILQKKIIIPAAFFILIIFLVGIFTFLRIRILIADARKTYSVAREAYDAAKSQNIFVAREKLVETQKQIAILRSDLGSVSWLRFVPIANLYFSDVKSIIEAGDHGIKAGIITADSLIPYADILGLKGEKSFVQGSAEDRIRIAVETLDKIVPKIDEIENEIQQARKKIDEVDVNHYPNFWKFRQAREKVQAVRNIVDQGGNAIEEGKPLIKVLPDLLGAKQNKRYLVLFQNDKELRPTGGFLTFYSIFRVDKGIIHIDSSNDIYNLDNSIPSHPPAPSIILKYLPKVYTFNIRDSNLSPDFVESMKTFESMYQKSRLYQKVDGIIALDTQFLTHTLDILGDVSAGGITFNAKNDPRCDCPQVVYQLEALVDQPVGYVKENRKAIIGELLYNTLAKALSSSPKLYWGRLFQQAISDAQEKHILFYVYNPSAQKGLEALNWSGRINNDFKGDYLHINDRNFAGAKANMFVRKSVRLDYKINEKGEITNTVTIIYKNPQPYSNCNPEKGGLCLNAILRNFQRVYVPQGSTLLNSEGSEVKVEVGKDLGKTVFEGFLTVKPLGSARISYTYTLPFSLAKDSPLPLLIQKQPGIDYIPFEIYINGKKTAEFDLKTDKILNLKPEL